MSKKYTAQEMRELADRMFDYRHDDSGLELVDCLADRVDCDATHDVIAMLRQAADMMERERKFEYTAEYVKRRSGKVDCKCVYHFDYFEEAKRFKYYPLKGEKLRFIRREVGEWEEVTDD